MSILAGSVVMRLPGISPAAFRRRRGAASTRPVRDRLARPTTAAQPAPCSERQKRSLTATPAPEAGTDVLWRLLSIATLVCAAFVDAAEMNWLSNLEGEAAIVPRGAGPAGSRPVTVARTLWSAPLKSTTRSGAGLTEVSGKRNVRFRVGARKCRRIPNLEVPLSHLVAWISR
jgi:hypothetical protein